jgi:catechol 2,3-dioxygenase-like lactoylglutathione lyase family enzyme
MAFHHLALATRDLQATHRFYTEAMGFTLAKVVIGPTETADGWARHVFYDTGGNGLMAFWELNDESLPDFDPAISTGIGLPAWVNHVAFDATPDTLAEGRDRWLAAGIDVAEVNHGFCISIYATDPNGVLVEWCCDTRELNDDDRLTAERLLADPAPPFDPPPDVTFHQASPTMVQAPPPPSPDETVVS